MTLEEIKKIENEVKTIKDKVNTLKEKQISQKAIKENLETQLEDIKNKIINLGYDPNNLETIIEEKSKLLNETMSIIKGKLYG